MYLQMKQLSSVFVVVICIASGSKGENFCYIGQEPGGIWKAQWEPCVEGCDNGVVLGGANFHVMATTTGRYMDLVQWASNEANVPNFSCAADDQPPEIACPEDQQLPTAPGKSYAFVNWITPPAEDNSGFEPSVECNRASGSKFPLGTTEVVCVATDVGQNSKRCRFRVNVVDSEAPRIQCPAHRNVSTEPGSNVARVTWTWEDPMVMDNSGLGPSVTCDRTKESTFEMGITIAECVATDAALNSNTCQFSVNVIDQEPPSIHCPSSLTAQSADIDTSALVPWPELQVSDNSQLPVSYTCIPASGSFFAPGNTTVICSAIDWAMNSQDCQFDIFVEVDCLSVYHGGIQTSGVYRILPRGFNHTSDVYCDMDTAGGPWIVFQKRFDGSVDFYRSWEDYRRGFGDLEGEFWLGNRLVHKLTRDGTWQLRVDMGDWSDPMETAYAFYETFSIRGEKDNFKLSINGYNGTAGDSLAWHNTQQFYTYDQDSSHKCAFDCHGAWWYTSCRHSNLNGPWGGPGLADIGFTREGTQNCPELMNWFHFEGDWEAVKTTEMKIRRKPVDDSASIYDF